MKNILSLPFIFKAIKKEYEEFYLKMKRRLLFDLKTYIEQIIQEEDLKIKRMKEQHPEEIKKIEIK